MVSLFDKIELVYKEVVSFVETTTVAETNEVIGTE